MPRFACLVLLALMLSGCAPAAVVATRDAVHDPYEARNRAVFAANTRLDRALIGGGASAYGQAVPEPVRRAVDNVADTLDLPSSVVNDVLQARGEDAVHNIFRLVLNATLGIGGLFDVAGAIGLEKREADFGQTLAVWGAPEGAYLVLPLLGPSTERDAAGKVVDFALNPLRPVLGERGGYQALAIKVAAKIGTRGDYADALEDMVYDSADPYAQARILYLQNRRFEVAGGTADDDYFDPYEVPE